MATQRFQIEGMDCPSCARTLQEGVARLVGVERCEVAFEQGALNVAYDPARVDGLAITQRVQALGYRVAEAIQPSVAQNEKATTPVLAFLTFLLGRKETGLPLLAGGALLLTGLLLRLLGLPVAAAATETVALLVAVAPIAISGLRALVVARQMSINLLMTIAAIGALVLGDTAEAATLVVLFTVGEALEGFAAGRSRAALQELMQLAPAEATLLQPCVDCEEHLGQQGYVGGPCPLCAPHAATVPVVAVLVGQRLLVRPGERVPLDGTIAAGASALNQQPITGESMPVERGPGDQVFAGSINGDGALEVVVTAPAGATLLSRIAELVRDAQSRRAPIERTVDRFAAIYTPAVVVAATLMATLPPLLLGQPFWDTATGTGWLYRALTLLVVACPCALVISTPVTVVSALVAAARSGALVKGGAALEALRSARVFAFDKTGTLTLGRPQVAQVACADGCAPAQECDRCDDLLALAAAVESHSAHPLAAAVVHAAADRQLAGRFGGAESVVALPGRGVEGWVGGRKITVGSHRLFDAEYPHPAALCRQVAAAEDRGQTALLVCDGTEVQGFITMADTPRPAAQAALAALRTAGVAHIAVLTGDNRAAGAALATAVGADTALSELLPGAKLAAIDDLRRRYGPVAMVGDGVNDTPALAAADVGIALGAGSAQALEVADVVLVGNDLGALPRLVQLSQRAGAIVRANITLSLASKVLFLMLALAGWATLWLAVVADVGVSLAVTLNGLRLLKENKG